MACSGTDEDNSPWQGEGSASARRACGNATNALREFASGTRTGESTLAALEDASGKARTAAAVNPKWQPLAQVIVASIGEMRAGQPAGSTRALIQNCGMQGRSTGQR